MGRKGARLTEKATVISEWLERSLVDIGDISRRKMFGGYGVFESGVMFALVSPEGNIYFKVTEFNRGRFEEAGSQKYGRMPYFSVPDDVLHDEDSLHDWARLSIKVAHDAQTKQK